MATRHSLPPNPPGNDRSDPPPWPTFSIGSRDVPAQVCIIPGHLAADLALADNTYYCGISEERLHMTPDLATLFFLSFRDLNPTPIAPRIVALGAQGIRSMVCRRLLEDAAVVIDHLRYAVEALEGGRWEEYASASTLIDARLQGMAKRGSWLVGLMAIKGSPEDSYVAHLRKKMERGA